MSWTDDPVADFDRYDAEQQQQLDSLPVCECCGEPIQQETAVYYNDHWICRECETEFWLDIREDFLKDVELCM